MTGWLLLKLRCGCAGGARTFSFSSLLKQRKMAANFLKANPGETGAGPALRTAAGRLRPVAATAATQAAA